ncbi:hypothetical protein [Gluconobacter kanchanaburiensis]|uniref:Uncharacterized protein n=1 Tax=Gluconobacter kanchanaburiensis NBRC 103587 TaxID=1307948 RepID=A0A511BBJ6_9PROT|nr:hypothetical protein [Gluconobacter kanchanaburiensis]MBF0862893.1 hypothetical protein [Gluconobacter kanchanaburiensis]GBR72019.1 hypothetical protein AA103587_2655 [Gluconobacter kanchanaburiensis NBRC 103587]GEK97181.1 hypothetical protein GKA01_23780 [Gluconobacter kanchanaburiensis NBRC 103587]
MSTSFQAATLVPFRSDDELLDLLIKRLPERLQKVLNWLRQPDHRWVRIPAGVLFLLGGVLSILPVLGLWMLPVGVMLLSQDIPFFRRLQGRVLRWVERRHPDWLGLSGDGAGR